MGPGFESQVPQNFDIFCFQVISRSVQKRGPPYASGIHVLDGSRFRSSGPGWRFTMNPGQQAHMQSESQSRLEYVWAKEMLTRPPDLGPKPPLVYFFSFLYFFI